MPLESKKTVMIMAGESSGDFHGASLVRELKKIDPLLDIIGLGGARMKEAGVRMILAVADIAVVGITEAFIKLPRIWTAMRLVRRTLREERPALLILIDFPDFNLMIASYAKKIGIKVLYYISPQVWAWRRGRVRKIEKNVDKMVVILPFEEDFYRSSKVDVTFVGHPLLDEVKTQFTVAEAKRFFQLPEGATTIALLPGSREREVARHLPEMLKGAELINARLGQVQYLIPLADAIPVEMIREQLSLSPLAVTVVKENIYDAIAASDLAIVASGTATLEIALLGKPMIIIYRVSWLSYLIGRLFINIPYIGLVNIIAGKSIMPELIQERANPEAIATEALAILSDPARRQRMVEELSNLHDRLGRAGAAKRTARIAAEMIRMGD